jgi:hypothetical protein
MQSAYIFLDRRILGYKNEYYYRLKTLSSELELESDLPSAAPRIFAFLLLRHRVGAGDLGADVGSGVEASVVGDEVGTGDVGAGVPSSFGAFKV